MREERHAHCAVGKVKKASSSHVKKGRVISQNPTAGKSLPKGTKVSLVVSRG
jgi:beta-lactam-binding protein with PASTA domain